MPTLWLSPTEYVTGDPSLKISYPSVSHPNTIVTSKTKGDLKWVSLGLPLPQGAQIEEVTLCYQVSDARSFISQVRLSEMATPEQALVRHDDPTDLTSTSPARYISRVSSVVTSTALTLDLRLNFQNTKDQIRLGAVGVTFQTPSLVTSVQNMVTLRSLAPDIAQDVQVLGYYTPGDGGGGNFYWEASASEADNGGTIIAPDSSPTTGRWKRLVEGPLSVKWFGAKGDGAANDAHAIQQTIAALPLTGGVVWFPPGRYSVCSSIVVSGTKQMEIRGYGAQLETDGAIYALTVFDAGNTVNPIVVAGLTINQRLNTRALGAILIEGSWNVRLRDITVIVDGSSTNYVGAIVVQGGDPANNDTGSFWTRIENAWIRKLGSGDNHPDSPTAVNGGFIPAGIVLRDSANATVISGGGITFARDAILITTRRQQPMSINAVLVEGMAFEYCEKAVTIDGQGANTGGGSGIRIIGCRGEELTTFLEIKNRTIDFATAPALFGNYLVFSVKNYIVKPAGISTLSWDFMLTPDTGQMQLPRGLILNQYFGADMPLTINAGANSNRGLSVLAGADAIFDVRANRVGETDIAHVGSARWGVPRVAHIGVRGLSSTRLYPNWERG